MNSRAAIIREVPGTYEVVDLVVDAPRQGEVMVQILASGLCHSDDHIATGDLPVGHYPMCGGHEGAGVVVEVGPGTPEFKEGDHVVLIGLPACGRCRWCAHGLQNLCDLGAEVANGVRTDDPDSHRMALDGEAVGQFCGLATFSQYSTVAANQTRRIPNDIPFDVACLVGCGVGTGWGSAVNSAEVHPGHTVIVVGVGGIGINAVQGAVHAGAEHVIAVDPAAWKLDKAKELGATHGYTTIEEAADLARSLTNGQGADSAIVTVGIVTPAIVGQAFAATRKAGVTVVTSLGDMTQIGVDIPLGELTLYQKRLQGSLFGGSSPLYDCLTMLELYTEGKLKLDELITTRYTLDEVAQGYVDMHAGKNIRGVIEFS